MILLDSNIIIYAIDAQHEQALEFLRGREIFVSALTQIEVMGYWRLSDESYRRLAAYFSTVTILPVSPEVIDQAIALLRKRRMGLADAVIAASALLRGLPLATHDTRDFRWIEGLELVDPLESS